MKVFTLTVYEPHSFEVCRVHVGGIRAIYYAAMHTIRFERRAGRECPYMKCSDPRLHFWLTCCRMSVNYGFDI